MSSCSTLYQPPPQEVKPPSNVGTDADVRAVLRLAGEPLTLFGEDAARRKVRLTRHIKLYFATMPAPAVAYLNKVNGIGVGPQRRGEVAAGVETQEVRLADAFSPANDTVAAFRRRLLDASLARQKERIVGLRTLFSQHRADVTAAVAAADADSSSLHHNAGALSESAAAALLSGKGLSAEERARAAAHSNAHVHPAATDALRSAAVASAAGLTKRLKVAAAATESADAGICFSTMTTAAVNPNFTHANANVAAANMAAAGGANTMRGSEIAVGYADGRVWCYDSGSGDRTADDGVASAGDDVSGGLRLSSGGQARVASLCWLPKSTDNNSTVGGEASSDFLFVARRQNEVEMWRVDRNTNGGQAEDDAAEDEDGGDNARPHQRVASSTSSSSSLVATLGRHVAFVNRLACDPTGNLLVSTSDDMTACLWDVGTAASVLSIKVGDPSSLSASSSPYFLYQQDGHDATSVNNSVAAVDFHPDGAAFATTDCAGICLVWDARSGQRITKTAITHSGRATCVKWLPGGFHMATAGDDGIVHVYDTRTFGGGGGGGGSSSSVAAGVSKSKSGRPLFSIAAHTDTITSLSFASGFHPTSGGSGGGIFSSPALAAASKYLPQWLVTTGLDGRVSLWSADDGSHLRTLEGGALRSGRGERGGSGIGKGGASAFRFALPVVVQQWVPASSSSGGAGGAFTSSVGIVTGARESAWSLWTSGGPPSVSGADGGAAVVATRSFAPLLANGSSAAAATAVAPSGVPPPSKAVAGDRASDDSDSSSDSDDDGLAALRKKPRVEVIPTAASASAPTPPPQPQQSAAPAAGSDDSDSGDDALAGLRKK